VGRNFGGDLGGVFWNGFWRGGEEWCVGREMMRIIFGGERWACGIRKTNWDRRQRAEVEERRGGVGRTGVVERRGQLGVSSSRNFLT
jgi:hypothetical protein